MRNPKPKSPSALTSLNPTPYMANPILIIKAPTSWTRPLDFPPSAEEGPYIKQKPNLEARFLPLTALRTTSRSEAQLRIWA